jgi:hypothetical protein
MPDPSTPPQPHKKPKRFWLFAPYVALLVAVLAWTAVWWVERLRLEHALTQKAAAFEKQGYIVRWSALKVDGWPFRLRVTLTAPQAGDSAGWSLAAPRLVAQAMAYAPGTWVLAAPDGLTLTRPGKGAVNISGKLIRASAAALNTDQPRFAFEGDHLIVVPAQGAAPAAFSAIGKLDLDLQPGPDDQAALMVRIDEGQLLPETDLSKLASGKAFGLVWDARLTKRSDFKGSNWPGALQAWRNAGGSMTVANAELRLAGQKLKGQGGPLTVDTDGRLSGQVNLKLDAGAGQSLMSALGLLGPIPLSFKDGRASIGPVPVGAALKIG